MLRWLKDSERFWALEKILDLHIKNSTFFGENSALFIEELYKSFNKYMINH